jgi:hypothetical protein
MRRGSLCVVAIAIAVLASSCGLTQIPTGLPIVISREGPTLKIAVCKRMEVKHVVVSERVSGGAWKDLQNFDTSGVLMPGDLTSSLVRVASGAAPDVSPTFSRDSDISVIIDGGTPETYVAASFALGGKELRNGQWLHDDDTTVTSTPCSE